MAILNQKRILNLIPKISAPVTLHVSQGDVGTEIQFTLVKGDELFVNPGNVSASVHGVREDGANFGAFTCTLSGSTVSFPLHSEMTAVKGSALAEVVIVDNDGNKVGSANFAILVEESVFPLGVTYDNDVSVYESILAYVQTIPAQVEADFNTAIAQEANTRSSQIQTLTNNLSAETTARQTADNSEAAARSSADALLQAEIDQLVAPSGEAPSAAEIENARIGADNVTYDTLGNAIRAQVSKLDRELVVSNLFDVTKAQMSTRLKNDGSIVTTDPAYILSDYIDVSNYLNRIIYFSESVNVLEQLDSSKTRIRFSTNQTSIDLSASANVGIRYIRISCTSTVANRLTVSDVQVTGLTKQYGYEGEFPIINGTSYSELSKWYRNNFNNNENILDNPDTVVFQSCSGYRVYENVLDYRQGFKGVSSAGETIDIRFTLNSPISLIGVQAFEVIFYIENVSNVTAFTLATLNTSATSYSRTVSTGLKNGWNRLLLNTAQQENLASSTWSTFMSFRCVLQGTGAFSVTFVAVNLKRIETAKLIFVDDHGYHGFKTLAYPLLKEAGCPVTWAINPGRLGATVGNNESILSQSDIDELAYDENSEFSFHNWNPSNNPTETMTPSELREDYHKCITYLKKNGICPQHVWRAALTQNKADNFWVARDMVEAAATYQDNAGFLTWPFDDWYNVSRRSIHGREQTAVDEIFERMRLTHSSVVLYTHGCVVSRDPEVQSDSLHCTVAEIEYLCTKISAGVSAGWLEPTTFNRLMTMKEHDMYSLNKNS